MVLFSGPAVALALLMAAPAAQSAAPQPEARAQQLIAATKSGEESTVACERLEGLGQALIDGGLAIEPQSVTRAVIAFRLAERAGRCAGAPLVRSTALANLADALLSVPAIDEALSAATQSVTLLDDIDAPAERAHALNALGIVHWWRNERDAALEAYGRSLAISTAAGDRSMAARTMNNIANIHKGLGDYQTALEHLEHALATFDELGERSRAAIVLNNIALIHANRGDLGRALEYSARALAIGRALDNPQVIAKCLDTIAEFYRRAGAYDLALQSFREALQLRTAAGNRTAITETTHNLGLVYLSQGDYELAIATFKRGLHLNHVWDVRDDGVESEGLRNIGAAAWRLGQRERAAANFRASLEVARRLKQRNREGEVLNDLGQVALAGGRLADATQLFDQSLVIRRELGDQAGVCESLTSLAAARLAAGQPAASLGLAQQALETAVAHDQPELLWQAHTVAASALRRLGRTDEARTQLTGAIDSIEQLSARVTGSESLRLRFFENKLAPYHDLIDLLVERRQFSEACEVAERSRARILTRLLDRTRDNHAALLTADERREQARLRDALQASNQQIEDELERPTPDAKRLVEFENGRRVAREALASFDAAALAQHADLAVVRGKVGTVTLDAAGRALGASTAALEFVVTDRRVFGFVVRNRGEAGVTVDARVISVGRAELATRIERFRRAVSSHDFGFADESGALYDMLIGPFQDLLAEARRLVIVPDEMLWNLPFQAMRGPAGFLIEAAAVSYAPSLTALQAIRALPRSSGPPTLLAMARSRFAPASGLEPLPDAEAQVKTIRAFYGPERSAVFTGDEATERQFRASAPHYSVIHLATHGVLDEASPLYSHLVLSPSRAAPEDDGRLEAWELMQLRLTADLVVLAACDTGQGRIAPGEGVIGTMWALFAARARSMVVSQFRVESSGAASLLAGFHRRVAAGQGTKADDLRAATLDLLHTPRFSHPYYWAGFILVGDPD